MYHRFYVHEFRDLQKVDFSAVDYSQLKFGSDLIAKKFGYELAEGVFNTHSDLLLTNQCIVFPSPYNVIPNAATILTHHFRNRLNELLVGASGKHVDYSIVHRKMSYTNDYGFLPKDKRKGLISQDKFFLNKKFIKGKVLIFIDDVCITGTHEERLIEVLEAEEVKNDSMFLYYAKYFGNSPDIEAALNFAAVKCLADYIEISNQPNHHVIIRPVKYLLSVPPSDLQTALSGMSSELIEKIYHACLAEGYYTIPSYQDNFQQIKANVDILPRGSFPFP
jgi:hypothetical protein